MECKIAGWNISIRSIIQSLLKLQNDNRCEQCPPKDTIPELNMDDISSNTAVENDETINLDKDLENPKETLENSAVIENLQSVD